MPDRQTKRERKEEARLERLEAKKRAARQARMRRIWSFVIVLAVIAGFYGISRLTGKAERKSLAAVSTVTEAAGCTAVESPGNEGQEHIVPPATATYGTNPPTSGAHYNAAGQGPLPTGVSPNEFPYEGMVHNLEHGHIAILWKADVPTPILAEFASVIQSDPEWMIGGPDTKMPEPITFLAWGKRVTCDGTGTPALLKAAAERFVKEFKDKAPESFPGTARPSA